MAIDTELAKRLRSYRNFKHLTQKDVAAHLNVPHSAISDIENGKRDITVSEFFSEKTRFNSKCFQIYMVEV